MAKAKPQPADPDAGYTVVARRYRPQQFADLIGQEHVADALTNAFATHRVAHAYLFTGARGTGKTSTARILAKALNCERGPTATPCDQCDICTSIAAGDDVDVVEIDAASNTGVDNIRELRQNVGFRPQRARFKVYIIDEVHMLSNSAFNALLKTLEEPPPHVKFIFATTEVQKIPVTILSRCQRFDFAHINAKKVFDTLKHIVKKEGVAAEDDALHVIARRAAGSMRDAQTLLDQLLGSAGGKLTADAVHALLGTAGDDRIADLADAILADDAAKAMALVAESADRGLQLGELADQLVDYWRGLMLVMMAGAAARDLPGTPALHEKIRGHAAGRSLDTVLSGIDILTAAKRRMGKSPHAQVILEVAVVRLSRLDELLTVAQLAQWMDDPDSAPAPSGNSAGATRNPVGAGNSVPAGSDPQKKNSPAGGNNGHPAGPPELVALTEQTIATVWPNIREAVGGIRGQQLCQAELPAIVGPNSLVVRFDPGYTSAYEAIASEVGTDAVRAALKRLTGAEWQVRVEYDRAAAPAAKPAAPPQTDVRKAGLMRLPLFAAAAEKLGAQLIRVDDGFDPEG